jgi:ABC-type polysaccharide/polyol phosphate transport system ATPase subunit
MIVDHPTNIVNAPDAPPRAARETAISVRGLSKMYRIYDRPEDRLKHMLWRGRRRYGHEFWALRDVAFEVAKGETIGIVGRNGSGKSTLLQIIAGTLTPTTGDVWVSGRVTALLELGSGFNPEFTGRENVFLNGAILGISREEMAAHIDDIIAFADIGEFIDQPVKIYSSGMVVRLAFAVQACLTPDILIVDEALSVGDMYFQTKCMAKIAELRKRGTSILFVSHAIDTVKAVCSRAILLDHGDVIIDGHPDPVTDKYIALMMGQRDHETALTAALASSALSGPPSMQRSLVQPSFEKRIGERFGNGKARYIECRIFQNDRETDVVRHGSPCEVRALLYYHAAVPELGEVGVVVRSLDGLDLFAANSFLLREIYPPQPQGALIELVFSFDVILSPGIYSIALGYRAPVQGEYVDKVFNAAVFRTETADGRIMPFRFAVPCDFEFRVIDDVETGK